jgi:hypothetical protein
MRFGRDASPCFVRGHGLHMAGDMGNTFDVGYSRVGCDVRCELRSVAKERLGSVATHPRS